MGALLQAHLAPWGKSDFDVSPVMLLVARDVVRCKGICRRLLSLFSWEVFHRPLAGLLHSSFLFCVLLVLFPVLLLFLLLVSWTNCTHMNLI